MGKQHPAGLTADLAAFIAHCKVFFVASAPSDTSHRVNVSPRAPGTSVAVLGPWEVAVGDLSGSGCETASHVLQNGRLTLLFVELEEGAPRMLRLHGHAKLVLAKEVAPELLAKFPERIAQSPGFRAVYMLTVERVTTSCGFSMPVYEFLRQRTTLDDFTAKADMNAYRKLKNSFNIDGMPSLSLLQGGDYTDVAPKPTAGYVFSEPLPAEDVQGRRVAQRRKDALERSVARQGSRPFEPTKAGMQTPYYLMCFAAGFAFCTLLNLVLSGGLSQHGDAV